MADSISIDMDSTSSKEHLVNTSIGFVSVAIFGDQHKPPLVTYPDLALNHTSCFQGLFLCPEAFSLLIHNFCIYHITPPGHQLGAPAMSYNYPALSVDDLADQLAEVLDFLGLGAVMCMGVTAGAYILTLFAIKYTRRVLGLILVSPLCKPPSWTEWLCNKFMANILYYYGMCGLVKELLLIRYFSKEVRGAAIIPETELVQSCRRAYSKTFVQPRSWFDFLLDCVNGSSKAKNRLLGELQSPNVLNFLEAINERPDITEGLKRLQCRSLIFVGEYSPFNSDSLHMTSKLDRRFSALVEVQGCGSVVTEEQPDAMLVPLEYFLMGFGLYRPSETDVSPRSPLSPTSISPELYTPESMGLKLKPIKTRLSQI